MRTLTVILLSLFVTGCCGCTKRLMMKEQAINKCVDCSRSSNIWW